MKFLMDPSWWLQVVCAGIIISIIAGLLKDYISKILSRFSSRYKSWRQKRNAAFNRLAKSIAKEFGFIIYADLRSLFFFIAWCVTIIIMLLIYIIWTVTKAHSLSIFVAVILFGVLSCLAYYRGLYFTNLSAKAKQIYEKNKFSGAKKRAARKKRG